jgi:hypothetical protein
VACALAATSAVDIAATFDSVTSPLVDDEGFAVEVAPAAPLDTAVENGSAVVVSSGDEPKICPSTMRNAKLPTIERARLVRECSTHRRIGVRTGFWPRAGISVQPLSIDG